MLKGLYGLSLPDHFGNALRTAEMFALGTGMQRALRESAMLTDRQAEIIKQLESTQKLFGLDLGSHTKMFQAAQDSLARLADYGQLAQMQALNEKWLEQGRGFHDSIDRAVAMLGSTAESFARLAIPHPDFGLDLESYRHLLDSSARGLADATAGLYTTDRETLASLPLLAIERPPQELFVHVSAVEAISLPIADEEDGAAPDTQDDTEAALAPMLERLGREFAQKWRGGRDALVSRNPDRIAHVSVSFRELFRMVLHRLAPDDQVRAWSTSPADFDKGRPTRAARLRFATRSVAHPPFAGCLAKDFSAALELITLFDRGVHESDHSLTERQVRLVVLRMDQFLRYLLEIADTSDS